MKMAKSKQINFSLHNNYQASDKQANLVEQTDFIENPQNTMVIINDTYNMYNMSFFFFINGKDVSESDRTVDNSFFGIILETLWKLSFLKILLFDIGISLGDSVTDCLQASR